MECWPPVPVGSIPPPICARALPPAKKETATAINGRTSRCVGCLFLLHELNIGLAFRNDRGRGLRENTSTLARKRKRRSANCSRFSLPKNSLGTKPRELLESELHTQTQRRRE